MPNGLNNALTQNCELSSSFLRDEAVFSSLGVVVSQPVLFSLLLSFLPDALATWTRRTLWKEKLGDPRNKKF